MKPINTKSEFYHGLIGPIRKLAEAMEVCNMQSRTFPKRDALPDGVDLVYMLYYVRGYLQCMRDSLEHERSNYTKEDWELYEKVCREMGLDKPDQV